VKFIDAIDKFMHLVPGCPEAEAVDALRDAVIQFCVDSESWVYWVDKTSDTMTFPTDSAAQQMPLTLVDAYIGQDQLDVIDLNDVPTPPTGRTVLLWDPERVYDSIQLVPAPAAPVAVRLLLTWKPTQWATDFPDHLWFSRAEALKAGALSRLLAVAGTSYANPGAAQFHGESFTAAINAAGASAGTNRRTRLRRLRVRPAE